MAMADDDQTTEVSTEQEPKLTLRCKVVVVGDAGVGKTAITQVFKNGGAKYPKNYAMVRFNPDGSGFAPAVS